MVSLPPEWEVAIVERAKSQCRSVANYLETLAVDDVKRAAAETPPPAVVPVAPSIAIHQPPAAKPKRRAASP
jgi:hypothetical protein